MEVTGITPQVSHSRNWHRFIVVIGFFVIAGFYAWTNDPTGASWRVSGNQGDYFNVLMHGFLKGHLYMDAPVSAELKASPDPWNPAVRGPNCPILQDASYYNGRYYLYYGVTPLVTLMLPFRLVTGSDMPLSLAALCFAWGGLLSALVLWTAIRERYFPEVGAWVSVCAVAVVGVANPLPALLRRTLVYELPIAAGFCFGMLALLALYWTIHSARSRFAWLVVASFALGFAVGARLTYLFVIPILLVPVWLAWREQGSTKFSAVPRRLLAAAVLPIGAMGALMALYNYQRFGKFAEFGTGYQVAEVYYLVKMVKFRADFFPFNLVDYFAATPDLTRHFPYFIVPGTWRWSVQAPTGYWGTEQVPGMLVCFPICSLALLSLFAGRPQADLLRRPLRAWLLCLWGLLLGSTGCLLFFQAAIVRYMVDFTPALMLCAALGVLVLERWLRNHAVVVKVAGRALWLGLLAVSVIIALLFSFGVQGTFRGAHPVTYARVAKFCENLAFWNPHLRGQPGGPIEIAVKIDPKFTVGCSEPLLACGAGRSAEHLFLRRIDDENMVVGYRRGSGSEAQVSLPIPVKAGEVHRIFVDLGSLHETEPSQVPAGVAAASPAKEKQRWRIVVDDHPVLQGRYSEVQPGAGDLVFLGCNPNSDDWGKFGLNRIVSARRLSPTEVASRAADRCLLSLEFKAPQDVPQGSQTLLMVGGPGAEFRVQMEFLPERRAALSLWSNGQNTARGEPFPIDAQWRHLDIEQVFQGRENKLHVRLDGKPVATVPGGTNDLRRDLLKAGWGASAVPPFTGFIRYADSDGAQPVKLAPVGNRSAVTVKFKRDRKLTTEPLLVTGRNGDGDFYEVTYLDQEHICFKQDHWGAGFVRTSAPIKVEADVPYRIVFEFAPEKQADTGAPRRGVMHLKMNGVRVWEKDARCHAFKDTEVYVGTNEIGGSTCDRQFSGEILSFERDTEVERPSQP